jgi:hypothetical protein
VKTVRQLAALIAVIGAPFMFGCATTPDDKDAEARTEKVYRTGSNIPVRDRDTSEVKAMSGDDYARMRPPVSMPPMPSGGGR